MSRDKQTQPEAPTPQPQLPHQPLEAVTSQSDTLEILRRMITTFQLAIDTLTGERVQRFWTLTGRKGDMPVVTEFDSYATLAAFVAELRAAQNTDRENIYFLFIFRGTRVQIQMGRQWHLVDGPNLVPINVPVPTRVDDSGTLLDIQSLDSLAATMTLVTADESPPTPTSETPEAPVEAHPERVGEPPAAEEYDAAE